MTSRPTLSSQSGPSSTIWGHLPFVEAPDLFYGWHEDFNNFDQTTALCGVGGGLVIDSGSSVALQTDQVNGVLRLTTQAADNDTVTYVSGDNTAGFMKFTAGKKSAFECRVKPAQIDAHDITIGFAQEALASATGLVADADTRADVDFAGFSLLDATPTAMDAVFNTASGGGYSTVLAAAQTIVAATWYRFGVYCDGTRVYYFVNGAPLVNTTLAHPVLITTTNFPDDEEMAFYIQIKAQTTTAVSIDLDWVRCAMER